MENGRSKQKVIEAATFLFYQKGYHATSVRDIADRAQVNVSLISYYFKGKQGLLEYAVIDYFETYLEELEATLKRTQPMSPFEQLKQLIATIIEYKHRHLQLSCTIQRELSLDTMFIREITVTYLAKENHIISNVLFKLIKGQSHDRYFIFMQLKGMLVTPYVLHHEWRHQFVGEYSHQLFADRYIKNIFTWLEKIVDSTSQLNMKQ